MRFHLSDEQEQMRDTVLRYAVDKGNAGARREAFDSDKGFHADFWSGLMGLGLGGIMLPAEHEGMGLEMIDLAIVAEALGYAAAPGPFLGHALAGYAIACAGDKAQRDRWLPALASGKIIGTVALSEPHDAWEPNQWHLDLHDGHLTGEKTNVLYPDYANIIVVGVQNGELALVEADAPGMSVEVLDVADRTRRLWDVRFDATPAVPLGHGHGASARVLEAGRILLAADACGGANYLLELSVHYAQTREQFGGPIGRFQGLKHQLANMAVRVEPIRSLCWYAAHAFDHVPQDRCRMAAIAKAHATECFMQTARDSIEAHGGIGYTWDYDAQLWFKRAMFDFAYLGSPAALRSWAADLADWRTP